LYANTRGQFVKWANKTFPNRPLFGLGFSLGACILTNVWRWILQSCLVTDGASPVIQYVGEEGEHCLLKAAVSVVSNLKRYISSFSMMRASGSLHDVS
jgi:uncharacterized protein